MKYKTKKGKEINLEKLKLFMSEEEIEKYKRKMRRDEDGLQGSVSRFDRLEKELTQEEAEIIAVYFFGTDKQWSDYCEEKKIEKGSQWYKTARICEKIVYQNRDIIRPYKMLLDKYLKK